MTIFLSPTIVYLYLRIFIHHGALHRLDYISDDLGLHHLERRFTDQPHALHVRRFLCYGYPPLLLSCMSQNCFAHLAR